MPTKLNQMGPHREERRTIRRSRRTNAEIAAELDAIADLIAQHPEGIGPTALASAYDAAYGTKLNERTLRRRVNVLEAAGRIEPVGETTARVYRAKPSVPEPTVTVPATTATTASGARTGQLVEVVPVSSEGAEILAAVRQPLAARSPVTYDTEFLERYRPNETWYLPEEMRSRLAGIGQTPAAGQPAGTFARDIHEQLLIDLSWASSRLEGNQYSLLDTKELLKHGRAAKGATDRDRQMILNHKAAIELLIEGAEYVGFNRPTFTNLHSLLSENLLARREHEGALRRGLIGIEGSTYTPTTIPQVIEAHFDLMLAKAGQIADPFEQAFFIMVHLPYLQPFHDVNKRTSRLGANLPLIKANLCPLSFIDVPQSLYVEAILGVYELRRAELLRDVFTWAYERSCAKYAVLRQAMGDPDPVRLQYREQLRAVVRDFVRDLRSPTPDRLEAWALAERIPAEDQQAFVAAAEAEFENLHEGSFGRYRLRPSEFTGWLEKREE